MSKLNNMWQKLWGKQMNQIVEKVENITVNGKYGNRTDFQDVENNLAGEAQKELLKENFYNQLTVQDEIRRRLKALEVADDRLKIQVIN